MKSFLLVSLMVFCALADSTTDTLYTCPASQMSTTLPASCNSTIASSLPLGSWELASVYPQQSWCYMAKYDSTQLDSDSVLILAVSCGPSGCQNITVTAYSENGAALTCAVFPSGALMDDVVYSCASEATLQNQSDLFVYTFNSSPEGSSKVMNVVQRQAADDPTYPPVPPPGQIDVDVYVDIVDGSVSDCNPDYFSSGSNTWLYVGIGVGVVVAILIVLGAIGGFVFYKKKKAQDYSLYSDA